MEHILIISKDKEESIKKFEKIVDTIPKYLIKKKIFCPYKAFIELKNKNSMEAIAWSENIRGTRASFLYLSKELTTEQVGYCLRYLRDYDGQPPSIEFFQGGKLMKL